MSTPVAIRESGIAGRNAAVVEEFFRRYRAHDVERMVDLFTLNADFSYPAYELWGKQRVLRGDGKVRTVGKPIWTGFIEAFPNLTNVVHSVEANDDGDVVAVVDIGGTQQLVWGFINPQGKSYTEPHLFVFHLDGDGLIDSVTAYWNNADINRQLGHNEVD
jgi:ketosteroid isomerase-like protein